MIQTLVTLVCAVSWAAIMWVGALMCVWLPVLMWWQGIIPWWAALLMAPVILVAWLTVWEGGAMQDWTEG